MRIVSQSEHDAVADRPKITDEAIAALKLRVGKAIPQPASAFHDVTADAIRNYARGIGDRNPLYRDADYARASVQARVVAHPTFMLYTGVPAEVAPADGSSGDPLAGVHAFYSGEDIHWFRPIVAGDRLEYSGGLAAVELKASRRGGRALHEIRERVFRDAAGVVGVSRERLIRIGRNASRERASGQPEAAREVPHRYTVDEMERIDAAYEAEEIRGAEPRYWEDVSIEDRSTPLVKGPYTVTAYICFAEGTGPRNKFHRAHSDAYAYRKRHPRAFPLNSLGYPDTIARVHWDREMAFRAGLRETYDFGGERIAWMSHAVTNWMGDGGFLERLTVRITAFCFVGDTVWIVCRVAEKLSSARVVLDIQAVNQTGESVATARAVVKLPTRDGGSLAELPSQSDEWATTIQF